MTSRRTAHRLSRILGMLPWVIAHPGATVSEVCERFAYTRTELVKDLNLVFVCGLPGYGPGDLMVAYIDDDEVVVDVADYFSRPVRLTPAEGLVLLAAGMAIASSGVAPPALRSAVRKLSDSLLPDDGTIVIDIPSEPELVGELRRCALEGRVVEIEYTSIGSGKTSLRRIEPWSVFSTLGNWYAAGWCRLAEGERVFRVDRIRSVRPTEETFRVPEEAPPPVVRYSPGVDDVTALIRLAPEARWVADYYPVEVRSDGPDGLEILFSSSEPSVAARLLLRLGRAAELLDGPEVTRTRDDLRDRILARYSAG
jgi:proteasome accessory factor C